MSRYTISQTTGRGTTVLPNWPNILRDGAIGLAAGILFLFVDPFYSVPTGSRGVVTRFGKIIGIEQEGMALLWPWEKLTKFSIRSESASVKDAMGATSDTQPVWTSLTVRYSIRPDKVAEVFEKYSHDGDLSSYVDTATHEIFKAVTARYVAPDLIGKRTNVSNDILSALQAKLDKYGAQVINIDMTNFNFQDSYMHAINAKVEQEQLRLVAENELATVQMKQKQKVAVAEAEAKAVMAKADGEKYKTIAEAQGEAESTRLNAEAQARDIHVRSQELREAGALYVDYRRVLVDQSKADKWDGKLPENIYAGAPIPFLSVNGK